MVIIVINIININIIYIIIFRKIMVLADFIVKLAKKCWKISKSVQLISGARITRNTWRYDYHSVFKFRDSIAVWGDVYTIHKWMRNLLKKIQKYVPTKRNRETNCALQKHRYHQVHQMIQRNTYLSAFHDLTPYCMCTCSLRPVESKCHFLHMLYASLPWFCIQVDFYAWYAQKFALLQPWNWGQKQ